MTFNSTHSDADHHLERPRPIFDHHNIACAPSSIYNSMEFAAGDRNFPQLQQQLPSQDQSASLSSSSTSSIGKNSDQSTGAGDEEEVQSEYKGGPLDNIEVLEEALPVKKSLSTFYSGKSKSFTSLSDAVSFSSIQDITKAENEYTRKRKNLLAFSNFLDKNRSNILQRSKCGLMKRPTNSRSMLTLAASIDFRETHDGETSNSNSSSSGCSLPPLPPHAKKATQLELSLSPPNTEYSPLRSFSMADLQVAAAQEASRASINCHK